MRNFQQYLKEYNELKLPEGMDKDKFKNLKAVGRQFDQVLTKITGALRIQDVIGYLKKGVNPFTDDSKTDEYKDSIFVVFDTETTGLTQKTAQNKFGGVKERDQIYELAATAYDNDFKVIPDGTLHVKLKLDKLKFDKNPEKLKTNLKKNFPDLSEGDIDSLNSTYKKYKDGFKFDMAGFKKEIKEKFPKKSEQQVNKIAYTLQKVYDIGGLMQMTKADKDKFKRLEGWDKSKLGEQYTVERKNSEAQIIDAFIRFVKKIRTSNKDKKVMVVAQNLPYDQGMVEGELLDRNSQIFNNLKKFDKAKTKSLSSIKSELKKRTYGYTKGKGKKAAKETFAGALDTQDVFKKIIKGDKKRQKILESVYKRIKEKSGVESKKWDKIFDNPKLSVSLGKLGTIAKNLDWHTASNDVYVTMEATKRWLATIRLTHVLLEINKGSKSVKAGDVTISESDFPELFEFLREYGVSESEYSTLKGELAADKKIESKIYGTEKKEKFPGFIDDGFSLRSKYHPIEKQKLRRA
jgi:hypothetical protein